MHNVDEFRPNHEKGGMLFAITDQYRKRTMFGLEIVQEGEDQNGYNLRANLFWTEPSERQSQIGQSWAVRMARGEWLRLAIGIDGEYATLFTGCNAQITKRFDRTIAAYPIQSDYYLYIGKGEMFGRTYQVCF